MVSKTKNNKSHNVDKHTKEYLDVKALIAIIKLVTESQTSRVHKQPLNGFPRNKIKVLLNSGSDGDFFIPPKRRRQTLSLPG